MQVKEEPYTKPIILDSFKTLIPPLSPKDFRLLEKSIISEGLKEPICLWNGIIVDGHNRYQICKANQIPYKTADIALENPNAALAWVCANRINRKNITDETRWYLIGKRRVFTIE